MRKRVVSLIIFALAVAYLMMQARPTKADVSQPKAVLSSGGANSSGGSYVCSSNVGDALNGYGKESPHQAWQGFHSPALQQLVGVDGPKITFVSYLGSARPNPAQSSTTIEFGNATRQVVDLSLYDVAGRQVRRLHSGELHAGVFRIPWDLRDDAGRTVMTGVYFVRLSSAGFRGSDRMVVVR